MPPSIDETLPEASKCRKGTSDENGAAAAEPVVKGDGEPAPEDRTAEVGSSVNKADEPCFILDAELSGVEELGAIDDRLV